MTGQTDQANRLEPIKVGSGEGEARWWFGALAEIKASAADTGGQLTIIEVTSHPGTEAPLHVHHRDDEAFWILEGDVTFEVGGETIEASVGDYVFGPRGIPIASPSATEAAGCCSSWSRVGWRSSSGPRASPPPPARSRRHTTRSRARRR